VKFTFTALNNPHINYLDIYIYRLLSKY